MKRFEGKVALVTGGRSGIGQAIARRLAREGARVFTAQRGRDNEFSHIEADFSDPNSAKIVIDRLMEQADRLDVLVNNAGMMQEMRIEEMSLEDWYCNLNVNLTLPFLLMKQALPHLRATRGNIINTGSIEGLGSNPLHAAYCATKAGLHGLTRAAAVDLGSDGIRVNAVAPGWIDTELVVDFVSSRSDPDAFREKIIALHPIGRTGTPEDVGALVAFLASDDASFITGHIYVVDGGRTAKLPLPD